MSKSERNSSYLGQYWKRKKCRPHFGNGRTRGFLWLLSLERNWVFATNSDFLVTVSLEPNVADLRYFKPWILLDQIIWVWNIKGLQHRVLKILRFKYLILFQTLNSFTSKIRLTNYIKLYQKSRRHSSRLAYCHVSWDTLYFPLFCERFKM